MGSTEDRIADSNRYLDSTYDQRQIEHDQARRSREFYKAQQEAAAERERRRRRRGRIPDHEQFPAADDEPRLIPSGDYPEAEGDDPRLIPSDEFDDADDDEPRLIPDP